jgi:stearoyl-CoA desaturase (delta-9 desaturase)
MIWIPFWAAGVINGIGHYLGYRNGETNDKSRNIFPLDLLVGGECLHNNHHLDPANAKLSRRWFEFDSGWMYLSILRFFRLATVKTSVS